MTGQKAAKPSGRMAELAKIRTEKGTLLPAIKEQMLHDMDLLPDDRRMDLIHASELSHADLCYRAVSRRILWNEKPAEPFVFQRQNIFDEGNAIHDKWQQRMRRTGKLWGQWRCRICNDTSLGLEPGISGCRYDCGHFWLYREVPLQLDGYMLIGHADAAVTGLDCVVELKSVGLGTLRFENPALLAEHTHRHNGREVTDLAGLAEGIRRPFMSHIRQANMYAWMCEQLGYPFRTIVFIYEYKWNQQVREFTIKPSQSIVDEMLGKAAVIADAVNAGILADCPHGGCKNCEGIDADSIPPFITPESRPGGQESSLPAGGPGHRRAARQLVPAAARRPAAAPAEPAGPDRPRADGPVQPRQPVAEIPPPPAGSSRGRRVTRQGTGSLNRSDSTREVRREDSSGDESQSPRRRVVRRGPSPAC